MSLKKITFRFGRFSGIEWRKRRARFRVAEVEEEEEVEVEVEEVGVEVVVVVEVEVGVLVGEEDGRSEEDVVGERPYNNRGGGEKEKV